MDKKMMVMVGLICAGACALGCILPWASMSMGPMSFSVSGFDAPKGTIVFILALVAGAGFLLQFLGKRDAIPLDEKVYFFILCGVAGLAAVLTLIDFLDISGEGVSKGIGIILSLAGGIGAAVMALLYAMKAKE